MVLQHLSRQLNESTAAVAVERMLAELATFTDEPGRITRTFLSPAMRQATGRVAQWMEEAGLKTRHDGVGNVIGSLPGTRANGRILVLGSHLDTVPDAGRFDGALGVVLPIVALQMLRCRGVRLPYTVEIVGFSEEEGVRFASAYLGSKGYAGRLQPRDLALRDGNGVTVREALTAFNGRPFRPPGPAHRRRDLAGYLEVHLEQGPVLEARRLGTGVVSAIAGQSRFKVAWQGRAAHAGTTPMALRRDALAGAAAFVLEVERLARRKSRLVATVGSLRVEPGAANVIAGAVEHTLDVRHPNDAIRGAAVEALRAAAAKIAGTRRLSCRWQQTQRNGAVACSPEMTAVLNESLRRVQGRSCALISGAGHDAVVLASFTPVAMLFVRCRGGVSHHPAEHVSTADLRTALRVVVDFLVRFATRCP